MSEKEWPADRVERRPIESLTPYARNGYDHDDAQVSLLAASVQEFGWTVPVLLDEQGVLIAGHGRVLAAQRLGLTHVPAMVAKGWSEAQVKAYRLLDNESTRRSTRNQEMIQLELGELRELDFELALTGFSPGEIDAYLAPGLDLEEIDSGEGEASGTNPDLLVIGRYKIQLDRDELAGLIECIEGYGKENGTTLGFGGYLLRKLEQ